MLLTPEREYMLMADSTREKQEWMRHLILSISELVLDSKSATGNEPRYTQCNSLWPDLACSHALPLAVRRGKLPSVCSVTMAVARYYAAPKWVPTVGCLPVPGPS